jgi:hypothetical protein
MRGCVRFLCGFCAGFANARPSFNLMTELFLRPGWSPFPWVALPALASRLPDSGTVACATGKPKPATSQSLQKRRSFRLIPLCTALYRLAVGRAKSENRGCLCEGGWLSSAALPGMYQRRRLRAVVLRAMVADLWTSVSKVLPSSYAKLAVNSRRKAGSQAARDTRIANDCNKLIIRQLYMHYWFNAEFVGNEAVNLALVSASKI